MKLNTDQFFNRDLSWLRFNHRVLQEANDKRNPLYERIAFLAIFSSNLDEFFKVRVSDIRQIKSLDKALRKKLISKPNKLLKQIKKEVNSQQEWFGKIYRETIRPELESNGIRLISYTDFSAKQQEIVMNEYERNLSDNVQINRFKIHSKAPDFIENEALYLVGEHKNELIWVKINSEFDRFFVFPSESSSFDITYVDDILKFHLTETYNTTFYAIKTSRDAELYIDNEYSGNLLEKIRSSLSNRETGQITRFLFDLTMPESLLNLISKQLDITAADHIPGGQYHNFKDFFGFPNPSDKQLNFTPLDPIKPKSNLENQSMFDRIQEKDQLISTPYEAFDDVIRLIEEAAKDEYVTHIHITLYRVSKTSAIAKALVEAASQGKAVHVFIETKARFDEENNIYWGKILEEKGAHVRYSYPGIKVHSKICLIERNIKGEIERFGYIGTGNFNEKTAKIYTDISLMTVHKKITQELQQIFDVLEQKIILPKTKKLLVSPFTTRSLFAEKIGREIDNAHEGKDAYIILKMNSLQDPKMIKLLYKASQAGVKIRLLVRGICCLVPGIENQSENITVTSIVDRFLEHSRIYIFANDGDEELYIGSADWMTRNLDHRIEVIAPILDADHHSKLRKQLQLQLDDDVKARHIDREQSNAYVGKSTDKSSQEQIYDALK